MLEDELRRVQHRGQSRTLGEGCELEVLLQGAGAERRVVLGQGPQPALVHHFSHLGKIRIPGHQHNHLRLRSRPGKGTTFLLDLPLHSGKRRSAAQELDG